MRGRRPQPLAIAPGDEESLRRLARRQCAPWFQVRRARIVLAIAGGGRVQAIADANQCDPATVRRTCRLYRRGFDGLLAPPRRPGRPPRISPLQRAQIVQLACREPIARGLHVTHWSSSELARQAVRDGIIEAIDPATVRRILDAVDLQPHRTRYWRTARLDDQFKERAEAVLWCYANAERLAHQGIYAVCADEMPNLQVLERDPTRRAIPGSIEQQEFEYVRHGTVNLLTFLVVHTGRMRVTFLAHNDAENYVWALRQFRADYGHLRGVYLIHDGGPSHVAAATDEYLSSLRGWWHPRRTPARASWLNQSELLNNAFGGCYLKRGSWDGRGAFVDHVLASSQEYNRLYAHPFEWTWAD